MSFGGGGNSPLTNHVHDNNPGEGGALSSTLTLMGPDVLFTLITDNTAQVNTNTTNIAALTANMGKWNANNTTIFRNSVLAGVPVGAIETV